MQIRTKLILLMLLLFVNIISIMGYALFNVISSKNLVHDMLNIDYHKIDVAHDFRTVMHVANKTVYEAIFVEQPSTKVINRAIIRINSLKDAFPVMIEDLTSSQKTSLPELVEMMSILKENSEPFRHNLDRIVTLMKDSHYDEARSLYADPEFTRSREILFRNLDDLIQLLKVDLVHDSEAFDQAVERSFLLYSVIAVLSILLFIIVIWRAEITIIRPIKRISYLMNQLLLKGSFDADLTHQDADEIGYMSQAVADLLHYIDLAIADANRVVEAIARADFSQRMTGEYVGALGLLKQGVNDSANSVSFMMSELAKVMYALHNGQLNIQMDQGVPESFRNLVETSLSDTRRLVLDVNDVMSAMNQGDLKHRIRAEANGEFLIMKNNVNYAIDQLAFTLQALADARDVAEQASQAKSHFIHNMTHELRTPLNAIMGFVTLLKMEMQDSDHQDSLAHITMAAKHLLSIVNQVLDMSKIEAGKLEVAKYPFDFREVITDAIDMISVSLQDKKLALVEQISDDLPKVIHGDPVRLREVLINLLSNAIKFTEQGKVTISILQTSDALVFEVTDTGVGISAEVQKKLFKPFSQADEGTARQYGGTGLGLLLSKELIEHMGGQINLESQLGLGTKVSFTLPLTEGSTQTTAQFVLQQERQQVVQQVIPQALDSEQNNEQNNSLTLQQKKVLLVEDNKINQMIAVRLLQKMGITPDIANHGQEAMELRQSTNYDLILLDIQMPIKDGYTTIIEIREEERITGKHQIVVGLSANGLQQDIDKAKQLGMDDYLTKPIDFDKFSTCILGFLLRQ